MKNVKTVVRQPKNLIKKKETIQLHSFDEVFNEFSKNKEFVRAYNAELERMRLSKQIREMRIAQHMTQKVVAQKTGMPQSVIARIESGESGITLDTLGRIAHAFGKNIQLA
jgi:DNA-binding XRE family transcriptional regulator